MPEGNRSQDERTVADIDGMPGIVPALITRHDIETLGQKINDLALAFITPLRADDDDDHKISGQ